MKQKNSLLFILIMIALMPFEMAASASLLLQASQDNFLQSRSFLFPRQGYAHLSIYNQMWNEFIFEKDGPVHGGFQVISIAERSVQIPKTAEYFLFNDKVQLLIAGDDWVDLQHKRDVRAEWLNLPSDFYGSMSMNPEQVQAGVIFIYNQELSKFTDIPFLKDMQVTISAPIMTVENNPDLQQLNMANPGNDPGKPADIIEAFQQSDWRFGKIVGKRSRIGLAELRLMFGQSYMAENHFLIEYHSIFTIPTSKGQNAEYLFDPFVGYNKHFGFGAATNFVIPLNRDLTRLAWCWFLGLEAIYLIHNNQYRTFDLIGRPWSRFLFYNHQYGPPNQNIPGVNLLTRKAVVRPFGIFDFTSGFQFQLKRFTGEIGCDIWGHGAEDVDHFTDIFPFDVGIAAYQPNPSPTDLAATASKSTIKMLAPTDVNQQGDPTFIPLVLADVDFGSGSSGPAFNYKIHVSGGFKSEPDMMVESFVGVGFFVDIPVKNGALKNWGAWAKLGVTF